MFISLSQIRKSCRQCDRCNSVVNLLKLLPIAYLTALTCLLMIGGVSAKLCFYFWVGLVLAIPSRVIMSKSFQKFKNRIASELVVI